jgi:Raf kinase inhibitor-like YbhB/YbcL family protein
VLAIVEEGGVMNSRRSRCWVGPSVALAACAFFAGAHGLDGREGKAAPMTLELTSSSFAHEMEIPSKYTCEGVDVSPPLGWSGAPQGTKSFALIVDDPDAPDPDAPKTTWVHWVLYDIPGSASSLPEHVAPNLPMRQGVNDWKVTGYGGPCPPIGRHRYFFKLYALDTVLAALPSPDKPSLERAMTGHILAETALMGTYAKKKERLK